MAFDGSLKDKFRLQIRRRKKMKRKMRGKKTSLEKKARRIITMSSTGFLCTLGLPNGPVPPPLVFITNIRRNTEAG